MAALLATEEIAAAQLIGQEIAQHTIQDAAQEKIAQLAAQEEIAQHATQDAAL